MHRWAAAVRVLALAGVLVVFGFGCKDGGTVGIPDDNEGDRTTQDPPGHDGNPDPGEIPRTCPPTCPPAPPDAIGRVPAPNPVPAENARPGNPEWDDGGSTNLNDGGRYQVELYTTTESAKKGDTIGVKVSTSRDAQVTAEVYRIGWYGGDGARKLWEGGPWAAKLQDECLRDTATARVECSWPTTFEFTVGDDWPSGLYVVKVKRPEGSTYRRRFAPFVVRDNRASEILYVPAFNTYQAYNTYGGASLYYDKLGKMPMGRGNEVSYNRPFVDDDGFGKVFALDAALVRLIEQHGYDVTYASNLDFVRYRDLLVGIGAFVHGGQDEYWDSAQRDQVDAAVASGKLSHAFFGGNGGYWRTRLISDAKGSPLRTLVCYKNEPEKDPIPGSTVRFRDAPNANPESRMFGVMYDGWQLVEFPLVVRDQSHWLFAGTGLTNGALLHGLVGFEFDRVFGGGLSPANLSISLESPVVSAEGLPNRTHAVDRTLPSRTIVFSAGTIWWPRGVDPAQPAYYDGRVVRMTLNVLERALAHRRPVKPLPPASSVRPIEVAPRGPEPWLETVTAFAGAPGSGGHVDGSAATAQFNGPTGLAVNRATGEVFVADTLNNRIRRIAKNGSGAWEVTTIAGNGLPGWRDTPVGPNAMFRSPTGVAVDPRNGHVYVADSDNHNIRRLLPPPPGSSTWTVETYAGGARQQGSADGVGTEARFRRPTALAVDAAGNVYVADQANNMIRMIHAADRRVETLVASGLNNPSAIAVAASGELYFVDAGFFRVLRLSAPPARTLSVVAGNADPWSNAPGYRDGTGDQARFRAQLGLTVSHLGEVMVADTANHRIRKILPGATAAASEVYTLAGAGTVGTRLGHASTAEIVAPTGIVYLSDSELLVADSFNHVVRKIQR